MEKPGVRKQRNSGLCALGFEPNPKHQEELRQIEKKYIEHGWKVHFFPYAISDEDKQVMFYTKDNSSETEDWAASLFQVRRDMHPYSVKSASLSNFIGTYLRGKKIKLMKMDIEGSEFEVLTDLMFKRLLCKNVIKIIMIEFHGKIFNRLPWKMFYNGTAGLLKKIASQTVCNRTTILNVDDESYLHDVE